MKRFNRLLCIPIATVLLFSCANKNGERGNDSVKRDTSMHDITRPTGNNYLEDLLNIKDEADLKTRYPNEKITYDTIWGAEGAFDMGTYMGKGTKNEVQFQWKDSLRRSTVTSVSIDATTDKDGNYVYGNQWVSNRGIKLGSTTDEVEKINGKSFSFSGFGWDYGGGAMGFTGGKLETAGIGLTFDEGNSWAALPEKERNQIMGDQTVTSDNAVVKKIQPRVVMISVFKSE